MTTIKKIVWLLIFSISMGYLEASAVVYLRDIYYPDGFHLPWVNFDQKNLKTEILRELCTLIMLMAVTNLSAHSFYRRMAHLLFCFGIWDISYYIFLKCLVNWPQSILSSDILFLFPVPWLGPVLAPCIISVNMIAISISLFYFSHKKTSLKIIFLEWLLLLSGALVVLISFTLNYFYKLAKDGLLKSWNNYQLPNTSGNLNLFEENFNWYIFSFGEILILAGLIILIRRLKNLRRPY